MGKRAKEHRKKVAKRNESIKQSQKIYEKMYQEMMRKEIEKIRNEKSGNTENNITE
jgi:hypothetical protein